MHATFHERELWQPIYMLQTLHVIDHNFIYYRVILLSRILHVHANYQSQSFINDVEKVCLMFVGFWICLFQMFRNVITYFFSNTANKMFSDSLANVSHKLLDLRQSLRKRRTKIFR